MIDAHQVTCDPSWICSGGRSTLAQETAEESMMVHLPMSKWRVKECFGTHQGPVEAYSPDRASLYVVVVDTDEVSAMQESIWGI